MRINKFLADAGIASRRASDKLIEEGKVTVNGKVADVGTIVDPTKDKVLVNGKPAVLQSKNYYIILHKPKGYVSTVSDDRDRKTVMDLIDIKARLFPVGRLDYDTEGLLLITNDGELSNKLTHPKNQIDKVYIARLSGQLPAKDAEQLRSGVVIDGKLTSPCKLVVLEQDAHHTRVELTIHEGRNRQVKKMFECIGKQVEFLKRTAVGELRLGGLARGKYRFCTQRELDYLEKLKG